MKKPELLAPAGNMDALKAAIIAGADAVYIGGKLFGARSYASNFSREEIIEAINYAHLYGVKIYITVNTLIYDNEVDSFLEYIDFIHKNNVDAIIIEDLGMMDLVRKTYPNLEIHASTQMNIHNLEGVKFASDMGIKRVVLARETDYEYLKYIKENSNIELEIFIHGALCMCYSGICYLSKFLTGRSGNRGTCSQPCRMKYDLYSGNKKLNNDKYLLSTKDLNTIFNIDKLIDLGIDSLKVEGRMKSSEYVYLVTSLYRKAIDSYISTGKINITSKDIDDMKKIFNRDFTKGFLFNEDNNNFTNEFRPNHIGIPIGKVIEVGKRIKIKLNGTLNQNDGIRIIGKTDEGWIVNKLYKNNKLVNTSTNTIIEIDKKYEVNVGSTVLKTTDIKELEYIDTLIKNKKKIHINGYLECINGKKSKLILNDGVNKIEVLGSVVEKSKNISMTNNDLEKQIKKLGDTIYILDNLEINKDDNIFIQNKDLNNLRREAINKLNNSRMYKTNYLKKDYYINLDEYNEEKGYAYVNKNVECKYIYTDDINLKGNNIIYRLPAINKYPKKGNYLCNDIGSLYLNKSYSDYALNVTNSYTVAFLHSIGVKRITLSYELTLDQIENLINTYKKRYNKLPNLELIISSYPTVMVTKYSLFKKYNIKNGYLKDLNNKIFKLENNNDLMYIKNYEKIEFDSDKCFKLGINTLRIDE